MTVYAVGDIQGCYEPLRRLLDKVHFDVNHDHLWCVGDMVNRGPDSLETLRFLKGLGDACVCVLGNHDIHLLAQAAGGKSYPQDSLRQVLDVPDAAELVDWLRFRPLLHHHVKKRWCMVHAGLHPQWSLDEAKRRAKQVERILQGKHWQNFCLRVQQSPLPQHQPKNAMQDKLFTLAVLTRSRYCTQDGVFNWNVRSGAAMAHDECPWFKHPQLAWRKDCRVVYGHWAARGLVADEPHVLGLDTGCVWGGSLTMAHINRHALPLAADQWIQQKNMKGIGHR